jgi:hypothetical protein
VRVDITSLRLPNVIGYTAPAKDIFTKDSCATTQVNLPLIDKLCIAALTYDPVEEEASMWSEEWHNLSYNEAKIVQRRYLHVRYLCHAISDYHSKRLPHDSYKKITINMLPVMTNSLRRKTSIPVSNNDLEEFVVALLFKDTGKRILSVFRKSFYLTYFENYVSGYHPEFFMNDGSADDIFTTFEETFNFWKTAIKNNEIKLVPTLEDPRAF